MSAPSRTADPHDGRTLEDVVPAPPAPAALEPGDPTILGLPIFAAGSIALGLQLLGVVSDAGVGAPLAIIFAGTGLGLLLSTIWAARIGQTMVAGVFGLFCGFWLSYAALVLGLTHNWFAVPTADVADTQLIFQVTWAAVFGTLTLASVRLPSSFTAVFGLVTLALLLLIVGNLATETFPVRLAGVVSLVFAAIGLYLFLAAASAASGGRAWGIGSPLAH